MPDSLLYAVAITALVVSDVLLIVLGWYALRQRSPQPDIAAPEKPPQDLKALTFSVGMLGERLTRIESQLVRLQERNEQPSPSMEANHKAFEVAAKLADQGADVEELIKLCGLTCGEAELIKLLHGGASRSTKAPLLG